MTIVEVMFITRRCRLLLIGISFMMCTGWNQTMQFNFL